MVKNLSRKTLGEISQKFNGGDFEQRVRNDARFDQGRVVVLAKNCSGSNVGAGAIVSLSGFASSLYADAFRAMLKDKPVLKFYAATSSSKNVQLATAVEPIKAGKYGRVRCNPIFLARVHINDASHLFVSYAGQSVAEDGAFRIVAKSNASEEYAVCALTSEIGAGISAAQFGTLLSNLTTLKTVVSSVTFPENSLESDVSASLYSIPYVESISCVDGVLTVTTKYLRLAETTAGSTQTVERIMQRNANS